MIKSLTSLRGIFILFIFLHHAGLYPGGGSMAVAFFFVLSGFSLSLGYKDRVLLPNFSYKRYLTRRSIKFFPLHWFTLIADIPLVLMNALHWWLIPVFFINAALIHSLIPIQDVYFSYNAVSWFLADVLFFAVCFPFIFKTIYKMNANLKIANALLLLILYGIIICLIPLSFRHALLYISPFIRILDFVFGIYLALFYMYIKDKIVSNLNHDKQILMFIFVLILLLVVESIVLGTSFELFAPLYWPLIAVLILVATFPRNGVIPLMENKYLLRLGESSFTIFLVHRLVLRYFVHFVSINVYAKTFICLILTLLFCFTIERYILNPITQWLTKRSQQSMTARL